MEKILTSSINYLNTTNNEEWKAFLNPIVTETRSYHNLSKGIITLYKPLLTDIQRLKLVAFPSIKHKFPSQIDLFNPYFSYFEDEQKCLITIKKLLKTNPKGIDSELSILSICGIIGHTIGETHVENTTRLINAVEIQSTLNSGISVNVPNELINPINHPLVCEINATVHKKLVKKSNFS